MRENIDIQELNGANSIEGVYISDERTFELGIYLKDGKSYQNFYKSCEQKCKEIYGKKSKFHIHGYPNKAKNKGTVVFSSDIKSAIKFLKKINLIDNRYIEKIENSQAFKDIIESTKKMDFNLANFILSKLARNDQITLNTGMTVSNGKNEFYISAREILQLSKEVLPFFDPDSSSNKTDNENKILDGKSEEKPYILSDIKSWINAAKTAYLAIESKKLKEIYYQFGNQLIFISTENAYANLKKIISSSKDSPKNNDNVSADGYQNTNDIGKEIEEAIETTMESLKNISETKEFITMVNSLKCNKGIPMQNTTKIIHIIFHIIQARSFVLSQRLTGKDKLEPSYRALSEQHKSMSDSFSKEKLQISIDAINELLKPINDDAAEDLKKIKDTKLYVHQIQYSLNNINQLLKDNTSRIAEKIIPEILAKFGLFFDKNHLKLFVDRIYSTLPTENVLNQLINSPGVVISSAIDVLNSNKTSDSENKTEEEKLPDFLFFNDQLNIEGDVKNLFKNISHRIFCSVNKKSIMKSYNGLTIKEIRSTLNNESKKPFFYLPVTLTSLLISETVRRENFDVFIATLALFDLMQQNKEKLIGNQKSNFCNMVYSNEKNGIFVDGYGIQYNKNSWDEYKDKSDILIKDFLKYTNLKSINNKVSQWLGMKVKLSKDSDAKLEDHLAGYLQSRLNMYSSSNIGLHPMAHHGSFFQITDDFANNELTLIDQKIIHILLNWLKQQLDGNQFNLTLTKHKLDTEYLLKNESNEKTEFIKKQIVPFLEKRILNFDAMLNPIEISLVNLLDISPSTLLNLQIADTPAFNYLIPDNIQFQKRMCERFSDYQHASRNRQPDDIYPMLKEKWVHHETVADGNCALSAVALGLLYHKNNGDDFLTTHAAFRTQFALSFSINPDTFTSAVFSQVIDALLSPAINLENPIIKKIINQLRNIENTALGTDKDQISIKIKAANSKAIKPEAFNHGNVRSECFNEAVKILARQGILYQLAMAYALRCYCVLHSGKKVTYNMSQVDKNENQVIEFTFQITNQFGKYLDDNVIAFLANNFNLTIRIKANEFGCTIKYGTGNIDILIFNLKPGQVDCHFELILPTDNFLGGRLQKSNKMVKPISIGLLLAENSLFTKLYKESFIKRRYERVELQHEHDKKYGIISVTNPLISRYPKR